MCKLLAYASSDIDASHATMKFKHNQYLLKNKLIDMFHKYLIKSKYFLDYVSFSVFENKNFTLFIIEKALKFLSKFKYKPLYIFKNR